MPKDKNQFDPEALAKELDQELDQDFDEELDEELDEEFDGACDDDDDDDYDEDDEDYDDYDDYDYIDPETFIRSNYIDVTQFDTSFNYGRWFYLTEADIKAKKDCKWLAQQILAEYQGEPAIAIGRWDDDYASNQPIIKMLIENAQKFQALESIYIGNNALAEELNHGDDFPETMLEQGNYNGFFAALPNLKHVKINCFPMSDCFALGTINSPKLESLEIISASLKGDVLQDLMDSNLPNLQKLVLYLGSPETMWDEIMAPKEYAALITKAALPKLTHLGLVNAYYQDEVVDMILASDLLPQLEVLQLGYGTLTDKGAKALEQNAPKLAHLKQLDLAYSHLSQAMVAALSELPLKINLENCSETYSTCLLHFDNSCLE